ncbi:hypothetical protein D9758_016012 [Tetrapyrgos nigripes]|uniref:Uncharacterized protein n=1 Tax=Tetrapyrgos nigripes TaxID=182062 RepID=A0A8H5CJS1_9AGAR|nr:hypothetical protein D9758_016012 [Tetrapyrgos nigripes]
MFRKARSTTSSTTSLVSKSSKSSTSTSSNSQKKGHNGEHHDGFKLIILATRISQDVYDFCLGPNNSGSGHSSAPTSASHADFAQKAKMNGWGSTVPGATSSYLSDQSHDLL